MRIDNLYQFIVPLTFLAIWALTSLFNREAQPLPPRNARAPGPIGPKPTPSTTPVRPSDWRTEPYPPRPTTQGRTTPPTPARTGGRGDDEILILDPDTRRTPPSPTNRGASPQAKRPTKARAKAQPTPGRSEAITPRALSSSMARPMNPKTGEPLGLTPLSLPASPLLSAPMGEAPGKVESRARDAEHVVLSADDIQQLLQSPARVRESIILNELLQPPLSLRGGGFARR